MQLERTFIKERRVVVSTVALQGMEVVDALLLGKGGNPLFASGLPYETMVFPTNEAGKPTSYEELYMRRYASEAEARAGHAEVVAEWLAGEV